MEIFNQWASALMWAFVGICFFCIVVKITLTEIWQSENDQDIIKTVAIWLLIVLWWILAIFILGIAAAMVFHCLIGV